MVLSRIYLRVRGKLPAMLRKTQYRLLARANRLIAEAKQRINIQRVLISELQQTGRKTSRANTRLVRLVRTLQLLEGQRRVVLERVRRFPLPTHVLGNGDSISADISRAGFAWLRRPVELSHGGPGEQQARNRALNSAE